MGPIKNDRCRVPLHINGWLPSYPHGPPVKALRTISRCSCTYLPDKHTVLSGNLFLLLLSLQSCLTLCDPIDGSPQGSRIPGVLQARILGVGGHAVLQGREGREPLPHKVGEWILLSRSGGEMGSSVLA